MLLQIDKKTLLDAERGRAWTIRPQHRDALLRYEQAVQDFIEEIGDREADYVIVYPNDDVYREYEPVWAERLPLALMHLKAAIRAKTTWFYESGWEITVVTLFPQAYDEFLAHNRVQDSPAERQRWAAAFCKNYRVAEERV